MTHWRIFPQKVVPTVSDLSIKICAMLVRGKGIRMSREEISALLPHAARLTLIRCLMRLRKEGKVSVAYAKGGLNNHGNRYFVYWIDQPERAVSPVGV